MTANAKHPLSAVAVSGLAKPVGLDVLVEQFTWDKLRAVARPPSQTQVRLIGGDELPGDDRAMQRVTIGGL